VSGIAFSKDEAKVTVTAALPDRPGRWRAAIFRVRWAGTNNQRPTMIVQNVSLDGSSTDITFTVAARRPSPGRSERLGARQGGTQVCGRSRADINVRQGLGDRPSGMRSHTGVALKMFETLAAKGINIQVISTSEIKDQRPGGRRIHGNSPSAPPALHNSLRAGCRLTAPSFLLACAKKAVANKRGRQFGGAGLCYKHAMRADHFPYGLPKCPPVGPV